MSPIAYKYDKCYIIGNGCSIALGAPVNILERAIEISRGSSGCCYPSNCQTMISPALQTFYRGVSDVRGNTIWGKLRGLHIGTYWAEILKAINPSSTPQQVDAALNKLNCVSYWEAVEDIVKYAQGFRFFRRFGLSVKHEREFLIKLKGSIYDQAVFVSAAVYNTPEKLYHF